MDLVSAEAANYLELSVRRTRKLQEIFVDRN